MHGTIGRARRILLTTDAVGGVWRYSIAIASGFAARGWRCTLAVMGPAPTPAQRAEAAEIPFCRLAETGYPLDWTAPDAQSLAQAAAGLDRLAQRDGAATLHLHSPALAAFGYGAPAIAVAHSCVGTWWHAVHGTDAPADFRWRMALTARGLAQAAAIIAPSRAMAAALRHIYRTSRPIDIVPNGLAPPPTPAPAPAPAVTAQREARVLTAGRLWDEGKNMAMLDRAAALLAAPVDAAGPTQAPGGARFAPAALNLLGDLAHPALQGAMARAALFAAPSLYEPFGLAVLEAARHGTPLVLAENPTFREFWDSAALFIDARDPRAWAAGLQYLLNSPAARAALGARAAARARRYTARAMVEATCALHETVTLEAV